MGLFIYLPLISAVFVFLLGILVFTRNRKGKLNLLFILFALAISIWLFGTFMMFMAKDDAQAIFWDRFIYVGVVFIPALLLHFSIDFTTLRNQLASIISGYITSFIFLILIRTDYFIKGLFRHRWGCHTVAQPLHHVFLLLFWVQVCLALFNLYRYYTKLNSGIERNRTKYVFLAFLSLFFIGAFAYLPAYKISIFPFPFLSGVIFSVVLAYAIAKYRLMDINIVLTRAGIFIVVYTLVLGIPFALGAWFEPWLSAAIGSDWWRVPLVVMAFLATSGPFIYIYLNQKAEDRLFREQRRYQNTLKQASLGMTRIRDLQKLLKLIVYIVTRTVRVNFASIYILDKDNSHYYMGALKNKTREVLSRIELNSPLVEQLTEYKEPLVFDEVQRRLHDNPMPLWEDLKTQMLVVNASVIIPSFIEDKLVGFMVLGDKRSGGIYSRDDLQIFTVLANQAALAIENARFFEEAKEMQEQISQAEKMATIGTMADGLSHQINNRFHALSLIAGDTLDTLSLVDSDNYTPQQKDLLNKIQHALERILANVSQGGEIVKGMLKYSRRGEEGIAVVSLDKIIDTTLEMVQYKVKLSDIDIIRDYPKDSTFVAVNLTQMQEVFFNLIDNANDSITERREILRENGYRGKIRFFVEASDSPMLKINAQDNGMGVKPEDLRKMFTPFFTTKTSSRKGTGLGLYVIKKIITVNHNGKISVKSSYKEGTTFTLELPTTVYA